MIGPAGPAWWRVPLALVDHLPLVSIDSGVTDREWSIIWNIRMPRVVLAGLVGAMLSVGGASYQGVFRNPLVDPYLLGAAAGAGLGATLMIAIWGDVGSGWIVDPVPAVAFVFALGAVALTYLVGRLVRGVAHHVDAGARRRRDGVAADGGADVRAPAQLRGRS